MKKLYLSFFLIFSFAAYALSQQSINPVFQQTNPLGTAIPSTPNTPTRGKENIVSQIKKIIGDDGELDDNERELDDDSPVSKRQTTAVTNLPTPETSNPASLLSGKYKNGTYTGNTVAQYYGNVQVQAIISNGKLTDIKFLQYPKQGSSREINSYALHLLKSEAIKAQSSAIDAVSGASETSPAFISSLNSALKQALN